MAGFLALFLYNQPQKEFTGSRSPLAFGFPMSTPEVELPPTLARRKAPAEVSEPWGETEEAGLWEAVLAGEKYGLGGMFWPRGDPS